jgi:WD40 repeat protein
MPPDPSHAEDVALLRLETPVLDPIDTPPLRSRVRPDEDFRCYGFPGGRQDPVLAVGSIQGAMGPGFGWYQLVSHGTTGYQVERGFSGSPVWSSATGAIVGIVVTEEGERGIRIGCMLPLSGITVLPPVADALAESLLFDPMSYEAHWEPAVRGTRLGTGSGEWYFTGRRVVLAELSSWLRGEPGDQSNGSSPVGCVVSGPPGSGKSAVLARVATLASSAYRAQHPGAWQDADPGTLPPVGSVQLAVHARDKSLTEVCAAVAEAADCADDRPEHLVSQLLRRDEPFTMVLDGLDEARGGGRDIAQGLLHPLAAYADSRRLRLLVGARPQMLEVLGPDFRRIHLDDPAYADREDLEAYTRARLATTGPEGEVAELAARIAERAYPLFLVAQLAADALYSAGAARPADLPATVPQALELYLLRSFTADEARRARDLLRPLTLAQGEGLPPDRLWARLAGRLSGRDYGAKDVAWLLDRAPALLAASSGPEGLHYGLFHAAFAESLGADLRERAGDFLDALLEAVPVGTDGTRNWPAAPRYVRHHLAHHAERAGRLAELRREAGYLTVADPEDVLHAQNRSGHALGRDVSHIMTRFTDGSLTDDPAERAPVLALRLMQRGQSNLAQAVLRSVTAAHWQPLWFSGAGQGGAGAEADTDAAAGHQGTVRALAPVRVGDREYVATCGDDGRLIVWDVQTTSSPSRVGAVDAHIGGATALTVFPGPHPLLISGGVDGAVAIWDAERLEPLQQDLRAHDGPVTALCVAGAAESEMLVSGGADGTICFWADEGPLSVRAHIGGVVALRPAVIGRECRPAMLSVGRDGVMRHWDMETGEEVVCVDDFGTGTVTAFDLFSTDGRVMALSATDAGVVAEHVLAEDDQDAYSVTSTYRTLPGGAPVTAACLVRGSASVYAVYVTGADMHAADLAEDGQAMYVNGVQGISALAVMTAEEGTRLLVLGGDNGSLRVWPCTREPNNPGIGVEEGMPSMSGERGTRPGSVTAVAAAMTDEGPVAVTARGGNGGYQFKVHYASGDLTRGTQYRTQLDQQPVVEVWRLSDGALAAPAHPLDAPAVLALSVAPEARRKLRFGAASRDGLCQVWSTDRKAVRHRRLISRRSDWAFESWVAAMTAGVVQGRAGVATVTSDGKLWFLGLRHSWLRRKRVMSTKHRADVLALGRIADQEVAATWSLEEASAIFLWDMARGRAVGKLDHPHPGQVTALDVRDSLLVAGGVDGSVTLFHIDVQANLLATSVHRAHAGRVSLLCSLHTRDGIVTVSGGYDGQLRFWHQSAEAGHLDSIALGTPVLSACEAAEGVLLVGTDLGAVALRIGTDPDAGHVRQEPWPHPTATARSHLAD